MIAAGLMTVSLSISALAGEKKDSHKWFHEKPVYWYERGTQRKAWMALDEVAIFPKRPALTYRQRSRVARELHPGAVLKKKNRFVFFLKLPELFSQKMMIDKLSRMRKLKEVRHASAVFYTSKKRSPGTRLVAKEELVVQFPAALSDPEVAIIEKAYKLKRSQSFSFARNTFLYKTRSGIDCIGIANKLCEAGIVNYAYPNWLRRRSRRSMPDDILFADQWHLENTGQGYGFVGDDINIVPVWDFYRGSPDEVVAIVDDGLEISHEDLRENVLSGLSWDYVEGDVDPTAEEHGTACGGLAAGRGFNGVGITGSAPLAGLVGYRLLGAETVANEADALTRNSAVIDIYCNSWGPEDYGANLAGPGPLTENALESGVTYGRGGLGNIFIWAGGNGGDIDNANYDGYANSRYAIAVAATTNQGRRSYYSEKGANILINAPSSGGTLGITTTDRTGELGYTPYDYLSGFGGTSAAAPLVSGVIALMLEANPDLTWRDVRNILIETAYRNDSVDADWKLNGAGYAVNHKYGFGRVDALAAVNAAADWESVAEETSIEVMAAPNIAIPDGEYAGASDVINIAEDLSIEFVEAYFSASDHTYWGDLEITLISPGGTESVLAERHVSDNSSSYDEWRFGSVRHYGESSRGYWTLKVKDLLAGDKGTFQNWRLRIYGTENLDGLRSEPEAVTDAATLLNTESAVLRGTVNPKNSETTVTFQYGRTSSYGLQIAAAESPLSGSSPVEVRAVVKDLTGDAVYHYRVRAGNAIGISYGSDRTFNTGGEVKDTDGDKLPDGLENSLCTSASEADTDKDGLPDGVEDANHDGIVGPEETNPCETDTDGDGMPDGLEIHNGFDQLEGNDFSLDDLGEICFLSESENGTQVFYRLEITALGNGHFAINGDATPKIENVGSSSPPTFQPTHGVAEIRQHTVYMILEKSGVVETDAGEKEKMYADKVYVELETTTLAGNFKTTRASYDFAGNEVSTEYISGSFQPCP